MQEGQSHSGRARGVLCLWSILVVGIVTGASSAGYTQQVVADFYVSPQGNDRWSGRLPEPAPDGTDGPFATLERAREAVRALKDTLTNPREIRVLLRGGVYRLTRPIIFRPEDSGSEKIPIVYAAYPGEKPILSGAIVIRGWQPIEGTPLWRAPLPELPEGVAEFRQLFVDGRRATVARMPNEGETYRTAGPGKPFKDRSEAIKDPETRLSIFFNEGDIKNWPDRDRAVVVVYHSWTTSRHRIAEVDVEKRWVRFTAGSGWPMGYWEKNQRYYVEGIREALDAPGEWYLDLTNRQVWYYPRPGENPAEAVVEVPVVEELLRIEGDPLAGKPVTHLIFDGLAFYHTDWVMPQAAPVDGQAAAFLTTAAVHVRGARHCEFRRCEVAHTGGYALWLSRGSKHCRLEQCHMHDLGAGAVRIGENTLPEEPELQASHNEVFNCFLHDGGKVYHAGVGVLIGRSSYNRVAHCEICDFFYTGVSVGWSWGYAPSSANHNIVEFNHIHHLGWGQLSDMGGVYTLGVSPGTVIRGNIIHDVLSYSYGGWGLYTDEGSTHIVLEKNLVYRVKDGAFHQHYGRENVVRNNILALSATYGQVRRSREEDHISFTLERNIFLSRGVPMLGGVWSNGQFRLEKNLYWDELGEPKFPGGLTLEKWQAKGFDQGSLVADPKFVNVAAFDFRLQEDSPAWQLGFEPVELDKVGLVGPEEWRQLPRQVSRPRLLLPGEQ